MSKILHKRTNGETSPSAEILEYGELAINYKTGSEKLYIKNDTDQVLELPLSGMDELSQVFIFDKDVIKHGEVTVDGETKYSLFKTIKWCMDEQGYNVIDCSLVTSNTIETETLVIDKPIKVLFPRTIMTFVGDGHAIHLQSNNVILQGLGRADKVNTTSSEAVADMEGYLNSTLSGTTCIRMAKASYEPHYHVYSRGYKSMTMDNINFVGIRSQLGQSYQHPNENKRLHGVGGIYLEKQAPDDTVAGNTVSNCQITNCGIFDTIAHGIYIDTPILSTIKYTRISGAGGHGVFINGGTSIDINTVFVGSANLGGIVCLHLSYSTIMNCASEYNAQAYVLRSCKCISMYSPACEDTKNLGTEDTIWSNGHYGLKLTTTNATGGTFEIKDVNEDTRTEMNGTGILIVGGKSINVFSFYGKDLGYMDSNTDTATAKKNRFIKIKGKAKGVHIQNPYFVRNNYMPTIRNEIEITNESDGTPQGVEIIWDVASESTFTNPSAYITYTDTANVPICDKTQSASVHCGQKYYTNIVFVGDTGIPNTTYE